MTERGVKMTVRLPADLAEWVRWQTSLERMAHPEIYEGTQGPSLSEIVETAVHHYRVIIEARP